MEIESLNQLIKIFSRLPGLGPRSARRIVLHLLKNPQTIMARLAEYINEVNQQVKTCQTCGNLDVSSPCNVCLDDLRDHSTICVIEDVADLWAIERGASYKGTYHVLGGVLSAIDGITPDKLSISSLQKRLSEQNIQEVIIATNATLEGQTTGHYIAQLLRDSNIKISRLAHGIPMGAELDYMDEGTLSLALKMRQDF